MIRISVLQSRSVHDRIHHLIEEEAPGYLSHRGIQISAENSHREFAKRIEVGPLCRLRGLEWTKRKETLASSPAFGGNYMAVSRGAHIDLHGYGERRDMRRADPTKKRTAVRS